MHLVVCSTDYPPAVGGIARYSHQIAKALAKTDRVTVLAARAPGCKAFDSEQPFPTVRVSNTPLVREAGLLRALLNIHRANPIDYVLNGVWFPCGLVSHVGHRLAGMKYLLAAHSSEIFDDNLSWRRMVKGLFKVWKRRMFKGASVVLPVSRYTRDRLAASGVAAPMYVLHNGVDVEAFHPEPKSDALLAKWKIDRGACVLLSVGRLDLHKGHDVVLRALPQILRLVPGLVYVLVGDGPERRPLMALIRSLGLASVVRMVGVAQERELADYYNLCDVFILLSREMPGRTDLIEGFGIAYLEAAACGKPVVAGHSGGVPEAVLDGHTGLLVDPVNVEAVAEAVTRLCLDAPYARMLGTNGRKRCEDELNWGQVARRLREKIAQAEIGG